MRRQLVALAAAVTATVVVAFLVPLALLVRTVAAERALNRAEQAVRAVAPAVAAAPDRAAVDRAVAAVQDPDQTITVHLPGEPGDANVERARAGESFVADAEGGRELVVPVVGAGGQTTVVRALVPAAVLTRGVARAWALLAALGLGLVALAVGVGDRLGRTIVDPTVALAETARRLGAGELDARVAPGGPPEVRAVGTAMNGLAGRITELLAAERELVADLSHRLRTPLTALRLDVEAVRDPALAERLRQDVEAVGHTVSRIIDRARSPLEEGRADLGEVVGRRAAYWAALAEEQDRPWHVEIGPGPHPVPAGAEQVEAAVDTLLENVFAHTPDGTACWIRVDAVDGTPRLVVEDAGPGLPDPSVVARGASDGASTGLGLDIARRLAESTGGALHVGDRAGGGARLELRFGPVSA